MTQLEALGLVTGVITLFETGYVIGAWRARKQRASAEDELIANRLRQVLGSVRVKKVSCDPQRLPPGQTASITLTVASEVSCALEVWIGASLVHHSGREYYDTDQDKPVMLEPGTKTYRRSLTVPAGTSHGDYSLIAAVWLGKAGSPENSIRLDGMQHEGVVKIRAK